MDLVFHPVFLEHDTGSHPEKPERIKWALKEDYLTPPNGRRYLKLVHSRDYVEKVKEASRNSRPLDADTPTSRKSFEAACYAVGAAIKASDIGGFALVRPPGHHAPYGGFCLFNNMAIASLRLVEKGKRVLIIDWDAHHGQGTQNAVLGREGLHYLSTHEWPLYPGTGFRSAANCTNIPLPPGTGDREYLEKVEGELAQTLKEFQPDVVGVSAGFDSMKEDPLAHLELTERSYMRVCEMIKDYDCFFVLEGGYVPHLLEKMVKKVTGFF